MRFDSRHRHCLLEVAFLTSLVSVLVSCGSASGRQLGEGNAAWFPDSGRLLYIVGRRGGTTVLEYDLRAARAEEIGGTLPGQPTSVAVSPDGRHLAYAVSPDPKSIRSDIYLSDPDGKNAKLIFSDSNYKSGLEFDKTGNVLFFTQARVLRHYSPIVSSHFHEMDVACVDLTSGKLHLLTNEHAYEMSDSAIDPTDGSVVVKKPGTLKDPNWGVPVAMLTRFDWDGVELKNPRELHPDLSRFLEHNHWAETYRNFAPTKDIYYPSFDTYGRLYFTWPTTNPSSGNYDYEIYRWEPRTGQVDRLTQLHRLIEAMRPSPDSKWIAIAYEKASLLGGSSIHPFLYSLTTQELRQLPEGPTK